MPLRHLVFLSLREEENTPEIVKQALKKVSELIRGVNAFYFGPCQEVTGRYNYAFFIDFENETARQQYLEHPEHKQVAVNIIIPKLKGELNSSVLVFDYQKKPKPPATVNYYTAAQTTKSYFLTRASAFNTGNFKDIAAENKKALDNCSVENLSDGFNKALRFKMQPTAVVEQNQQHNDALFIQLFCKKGSGQNVTSLPEATITSVPK